MEKAQLETGGASRYMIFQMGGETYGAPLLQVREVIENKSAQPVPNSAPAFNGVINLRGEVVGIIDLRKLMNITPKESLAILVFESEGATSGVVVDRCLSVTEIKDADIDTRSAEQQKEAAPHFMGIGKMQNHLVTILDLTWVPKLLQNA